jgi:hypothetical protein
VNSDLVVRDAEGKATTRERDVAQRVPQRTSRNAGAESDYHLAKFQIGKAGSDCGSTAEGNQSPHCNVKEQAAPIQKVTAQLDASKPASQMAGNP